jgi:hypothetical protein
MSEQIKIFRVPISDISNESFNFNITDSVASDDGSGIVDYMRNRNLTSAWATTGSSDAANTIIEGESGDTFSLSDLIIIGHNFKTFDIEYFDGTNWILIESIVDNDDTFTHVEQASVLTNNVRLIVYNTMVANDDKKIVRFIIAEKLLTGQFETWPKIEKPVQGVVRKTSVMLSGKSFISESIGSFSVTLKWDGGLTSQNDINMIESMFLSRKAFMIWLSGGDETQFRFNLIGYRKEDLYIVKSMKDYTNPYYKGIYDTFIPQTIDLVEVVE